MVARAPILIVGAPRSGSTWLAKIFDSHPDVVYRHEPDEILPSPEKIDETQIVALTQAWIDDHSSRSNIKRPYFHKSWRSPLAHVAHMSLAYGLLVASSVRAIERHLRSWRLPDLGRSHLARPVLKTVRFCEGIGSVARALPNSRVILLVRRPRGQVLSVMRGAQAGRFELRGGQGMPMDERRALACAVSYGVDEASFHALPHAAKYAWAWVAFNESAMRELDGLPNARIVLYEDLCEAPAEVARELFAFAGLPWHDQTARFVGASAHHEGRSGYYDVFQDARQTATRWMREMSEEDQRAVLSVVWQSPVARHWPDLEHPEPDKPLATAVARS